MPDLLYLDDTGVRALKTLIGEPTDEQVTTAVHNELVAHPEWTTTVQDGSITDPKLVQTGGVLSAVNEIAPLVTVDDTLTLTNDDYTFFGNKTVGPEGDLWDNDSYRAYIYQFTTSGKFYMNNPGYSSYVFIALFNGYPSKETFASRNYNGSTPIDMGKIDVTAGQYVFVSVNLLSTIAFRTFLDYTVNERPTLFRHDAKIAWFGDSISQLLLLPHRAESYMGNTVYDCSFAGAPLTHGAPMYDGTSVLSLSAQVASGDFSALDAALDAQEQAGIDVTQKRINATTLKGLDFSTDVTHVVIMAGTNDLNNDYAISTSDMTTFKAAVKGIVDNFNNAYPNVRIYFITDPYRGDITPATPDRHGHSLVDVNEAISEICVSNNIAFYDLYHASGINANTISYYLQPDLLHPSLQGDVLLAEKCAKWIDAN